MDLTAIRYHELQPNDLLLPKWKLLRMRTWILYLCESSVPYFIFVLLHVYVCLSHNRYGLVERPIKPHWQGLLWIRLRSTTLKMS